MEGKDRKRRRKDRGYGGWERKKERKKERKTLGQGKE